MATNCKTGRGADITVTGSAVDAAFNAMQIESIGAWNFEVEAIPVRPINAAGTDPVDTEYCTSGNVDQEAFEVVAYYTGDWDIKSLIGKTHTYTRVGAGGCQWESSQGQLVGADIAGEYSSGEVVKVTLRFMMLEGITFTAAA